MVRYHYETIRKNLPASKPAEGDNMEENVMTWDSFYTASNMHLSKKELNYSNIRLINRK